MVAPLCLISLLKLNWAIFFKKVNERPNNSFILCQMGQESVLEGISDGLGCLWANYKAPGTL